MAKNLVGWEALMAYIGQETEKEPLKAEKVHSPYNFVPMSDTIIQFDETERTGREQISDELYTGEIEYTITANTPIMVNKGFGNNSSLGFFTDPKTGSYAIPGSTVRGLIRSNAQILGLADVSIDIDDYRLMFREIAAGKDQKLYNDIVVKNVRAGYLENRGGKYYITETVIDKVNEASYGEMNYYVLSEKSVLDNPSGYPVFFPNNTNILQNLKIVGKNKTENPDYFPYIMEISYNVSANNRITGVDQPGILSHYGYALSTGKISGKRAIYVIPEENPDNEYEVPSASVKAFRIDYERKKNGLPATGGKHPAQLSPRDFFALPKPGEKKPVFFLHYNYNGEFYFGFTPRLRLFYKHTIHDGIPAKRETGKIDLANSIFGYAEPDSSYKSKVSFTNALISNNKKPGNSEKVILSEPKPTFYAAYLDAAQNDPNSYNNDEIRLKGVKQYWIQTHTQKAELGSNEKVASSFSPLPEGSEFSGRVRFENLTKPELGLLLWAIRLNGNCKMNIGYAKPYGYGAVTVEIRSAERIEPEKAYSSESFTANPYTALNVQELIDGYKEYVKKEYGIILTEQSGIKELLRMKNKDTHIADADMTYMKLAEFKGVKEEFTIPRQGELIHKFREWEKK